MSDVEGRDEPRADGEYRPADDEERGVVAHGRDESPGDHGRYDDGEEQRQDVDAGLGGGVAVDGLEVQGKVVHQGEERGAEERREADGGGGRSASSRSSAGGWRGRRA